MAITARMIKIKGQADSYRLIITAAKRKDVERLWGQNRWVLRLYTAGSPKSFTYIIIHLKRIDQCNEDTWESRIYLDPARWGINVMCHAEVRMLGRDQTLKKRTPLLLAHQHREAKAQRSKSTATI